MAKGYPSKKRVQKAYYAGLAGRRRSYLNRWCAKAYETGRGKAREDAVKRRMR
jgi:hypothetical protein